MLEHITSIFNYYSNIFSINICFLSKKQYLCTQKHRGVEQLVARWAHNPKVVCSSQASATRKRESRN